MDNSGVTMRYCSVPRLLLLESFPALSVRALRAAIRRRTRRCPAVRVCTRAARQNRPPSPCTKGTDARNLR